MPKHGDVTWGRIIEITFPDIPIDWDDEPEQKNYFALPGQALREMGTPAIVEKCAAWWETSTDVRAVDWRACAYGEARQVVQKEAARETQASQQGKQPKRLEHPPLGNNRYLGRADGGRQYFAVPGASAKPKVGTYFTIPTQEGK
jgi:hypothetical protein